MEDSSTESLYIVIANRVLLQREPMENDKNRRWSCSMQIPIFYVMATSEERAESKAREILGDLINTETHDIDSVHPSVCRVDEP